MNRFAILAALFAFGLPLGAADPGKFTSGSNGSDKDLDVTQDLVLPAHPDGVYNFITLTVRQGVTLRFERNVLNTPIYLLATGDIRIQGTIDVSGGSPTDTAGGAGGPGGFDGAIPLQLGGEPAAGQGPGAGLGTTTNLNLGGYGSQGAFPSETNGPIYGTKLLVPLVGGSGGGAIAPVGPGGGGGGGAVLLSSDTRVVVTGRILAQGGSTLVGYYNEGSGGAIRLVSPVLAGNGTLDVTGGNDAAQGVIGGAGRIRLDAIDKRETRFVYITYPGTVTDIVSAGSFMAVFPPKLPQLDLVEVAGKTTLGATGPVDILLPFNSSAQQTVKVRALNFQGIVPIRVVLTPDSGNPRPYESSINTAVTSEVAVTVTFPLNVRTHVLVFTR